MRIEHELREVNNELKEVETAALDLATVPHESTGTGELQVEILGLEHRTARLQAAMDAEQQSLNNLRELATQLEAQSAKLARSIVSHKHTYRSRVCSPVRGVEPRWAPTGRPRTICYPCLQEPSLAFSRELLISEQGAVEQQLTEAQDLFREREVRSGGLQTQLEDARLELTSKRLELDFLTKSYISEQATRIASLAAGRARLTARSEQLKEYLGVLAKIDDAQKVAAKLTVERDSLEQELAAATLLRPSQSTARAG